MMLLMKLTNQVKSIPEVLFELKGACLFLTELGHMF
jgi:hypothetical protein